LEDFDNKVVEYPDIDTTEVLIQCEASEISNDNANEITLVMVDENVKPAILIENHLPSIKYSTSFWGVLI
jgi:hypothetical protein